MCLIAFAISAHPRWPLVIAANRDEHYERPTAALQHWRSPTGRGMASGRDERAGGTWLGVSESARVAMLTNVREPGMPAGARSRGTLPLAWLDSDQSVEHFLHSLDLQAYSGFNLVVGDLQQGRWHWISNRQAGASGIEPGLQQRALAPGIYGLSNAFLNTPWPKTIKLTRSLRQGLERHSQPQALRRQLWQALTDREPPADELLPRTGVSEQTERELASAWVRLSNGLYGTRSSLLALAERDSAGQWRIEMDEKTWDPEQSGRLSRVQLQARAGI